MAIRDWPASERPREKLLQKGAQALSDAELLAIFLRTGVEGKSAVDLARELLGHFGGLGGLLSATETAFCSAHGLGPAKYAQLQAVLEMSARYFNEQLTEAPVLDNVSLAKRLAKARLATLKHEVFAVFFLDSQHRLIRFETLFSGTLDGADVYPREVAKRALEYNAAALILAHNHPSGDTRASAEDQGLTELLIRSMNLLDIRILDHIIVGAGEPMSFSEQNLMPRR